MCKRKSHLGTTFLLLALKINNKTQMDELLMSTAALVDILSKFNNQIIQNKHLKKGHHYVIAQQSLVTCFLASFPCRCMRGQKRLRVHARLRECMSAARLY